MMFLLFDTLSRFVITFLHHQKLSLGFDLAPVYREVEILVTGESLGRGTMVLVMCFPNQNLIKEIGIMNSERNEHLNRG